MVEGDDPTAPATMADIKAIETSIGSTIDAKFLELQNLILQLKDAKDTPPPNPILEDALASNDGDSEEAKEKRKRYEEKNLRVRLLSRALPPPPQMPNLREKMETIML